MGPKTIGPRGGLWIAAAGLLALGCTEESSVSPDVLQDALQIEPSMAVAHATSITELLPLPGDERSRPTAVNSSGQVVGTSGLEATRSFDRPVLWEDGQPVELPTLSEPSKNRPNSINDAGQIGGSVEGSEQGQRAALWEDGTVTDIGALPGHRQSMGRINSAGHVVGTSFDGTVPRSGFVWRDGEMTALPPVPGDEVTTAAAGNSSGLVVGVTSNIYEEPDDPRDEWRFVVWQDGEIIWLHDGASLSPPPDGNEVWFDVTDAGDAYIVNTDVGALWRWRDGELAPWPFDSPWAAHATGVSASGLVTGLLIEDSRITGWGVWKDEEFFPIDGVTVSRCGAISNAGHVVCEGPDYEHPFVALLDFGESGEVQPTIDGVLAFFDDAVANGSLQGSGHGESGDRRRDPLRDMLEQVRAMIEAGEELDKICGQLAQVLQRTDGASPPSDFVTGPGAATLWERVQALMDALECA